MPPRNRGWLERLTTFLTFLWGQATWEFGEGEAPLDEEREEDGDDEEEDGEEEGDSQVGEALGDPLSRGGQRASGLSRGGTRAGQAFVSTWEQLVSSIWTRAGVPG